MIVTIAFDVRNHVEVMEGWPIENAGATLFLEREGNVVRRVCVSYSNASLNDAPRIETSPDGEKVSAIKINDTVYASQARYRILNWQAVVSGVQVFNIDFDNFEVRFTPQSISEENQIPIRSFRSSSDALNKTCEFEQIGRAFCVDPIGDSRVESMAHYREGRLAFEAGRFVDSYNNMYLFLETRYCDGKTGTTRQVKLLSENQSFCENLRETISEYRELNSNSMEHVGDLFKDELKLSHKIKVIVNLRGKLRHHALKSPHRWDPNRQSEYANAARFIGSLVGKIVIQESLQDIYAPEILERFRKLSVDSGNETKVSVSSTRLEPKRTLQLEISLPTVVPSTRLCLTAVRAAIDKCRESEQLTDTVRLRATSSSLSLELFEVELSTWAFTQSRRLSSENVSSVRCSFEHFEAGAVTKHEFSIPAKNNLIEIEDAWELLEFSFDWIERKNPTTRVSSLRLFLDSGDESLLRYSVGAQVTH